MKKKAEYNRTIESVLNLDTGLTIYANIFLELEDHIVFPYREKCQEAYKKKREPFLICDTCGQMVQISGGKGINGKIKYFKHLKDSSDCPIKTDTKLSREDILRGKFNGQQEGILHIETKNLIFNFLNLNKDSKGEVSFAKPEMVNKSERNYLEWKKPDITSIFKEKKLVFEIQLATTFLDVIYERQHFYKENKTFIIWVFKNFEIEADKQRFTQKDIFYSNNRNAFILNEEAINLSKINNDLFLLCQYQKPIATDEKIEYEWESKYINLSDLIFDKTSFKVYYFDVDEAENKIKSDIERKISARKETKKLFKEKQEKIRLEEIKKRNEAEKLIEFEKEKLRSQEIERQKHHEKYKTERQKAIDKDQLNYETINALFFERLKNYDNLSPLQNVYKSNLYDISTKIGELFKGGYIPSKDDIKFLKDEYNWELENYKSPDRHSILYFLSLTIFYIKLRHNLTYLNLIPKIERALFAILSIKEGKVIGYNFKTLVEVPHQFIGNRAREEFTSLILQAINEYYGYERFIKEQDLKKTLEKKILLLDGNILPVKEEYKTAFLLIFKELIQ